MITTFSSLCAPFRARLILGIHRIPPMPSIRAISCRAPPLLIQHEGHTLIGLIDARVRVRRSTSLDLDYGVRGEGRRLARGRLRRAGFVEGIELDRTRGRADASASATVRDVRKAARGEEVLQGHTLVLIPLTAGQHLRVPQSLEAVLHGFRRDVLRERPPLPLRSLRNPQPSPAAALI